MRLASCLRMAQETVLEGVFAINKPVGLSSAQVLRECQTHFNPSTLFRSLIQREASFRARESNADRRRRSKAKRDVRVKMGHGGTLDPLATGVLIVGVGKGTKSMSDFLHCTKTYETIVLFGASTDTYDRVGRILKRRSYGDVTRTKVEEALESFRGKFRQMPPLYSALKMNGKPLYEYAREGLPIPREIETREVEVTELELLEWYDPGEHSHRWPAEEAGSSEQNLAEQVWRVEKQQATGKKLSPEEEKSDIEALAAHAEFKRKAEEKQDELVYDRPPAKRRHVQSSPPLMSGALGKLPPASPFRDGDGRNISRKGSNLVPPAPEPNTPPPWEGKGPPAAKIRMTVSSGFYVRSFCHDLGEKVGSLALMAELHRSRQAQFRVGSSACIELGDLDKGEGTWGPKVERALYLWNHPDAMDEDESPPPVMSEPQSLSPPPDRDVPLNQSNDEADPDTEVGSPEARPETDTDFSGRVTQDEDLPPEVRPESNPTEKCEASSSEPVLPTPREEEDKLPADDESEWNGCSDDPQITSTQGSSSA